MAAIRRFASPRDGVQGGDCGTSKQLPVTIIAVDKTTNGRNVSHVAAVKPDQTGRQAMTTVYAIHAPDTDKLAEVVAQMETLGAPIIEAVACGDFYMALEGSHRLAAAKHLGLEPILTVHEQDDVIDITRFDWFEEQNWAETAYPAGEVAGEIFSPRSAVPYSFSA